MTGWPSGGSCPVARKSLHLSMTFWAAFLGGLTLFFGFVETTSAHPTLRPRYREWPLYLAGLFLTASCILNRLATREAAEQAEGRAVVAVMALMLGQEFTPKRQELLTKPIPNSDPRWWPAPRGGEDTLGYRYPRPPAAEEPDS